MLLSDVCFIEQFPSDAWLFNLATACFLAPATESCEE